MSNHTWPHPFFLSRQPLPLQSQDYFLSLSHYCFYPILCSFPCGSPFLIKHIILILRYFLFVQYPLLFFKHSAFLFSPFHELVYICLAQILTPAILLVQNIFFHKDIDTQIFIECLLCARHFPRQWDQMFTIPSQVREKQYINMQTIK
jgi:hypothetical protein